MFLRSITESRSISKATAERIGNKIGVDWKKIPLKEFHTGINHEQEHKDVVGNNLEKIGKIAHAHLKETPEYYIKLAKAGLAK